MASRTASAGRTWRSQQFSALLSSAILEWVLMLLLLLEGLLSYLATTFAHLCKLQPPCPMCTRLDHVLGKAHPGFYRNLMCNSHKAEASSWAFCHIHQKLVDVHGMCEACLLSFATDNKSNLETHRSLVGKLSVGIGNPVYRQDFSLISAFEAPVMENILCSCCSRSLKVKPCPFMVLQRNISDVDIGEICRNVSRDQCIGEINHIYSELKTSDAESEPQQPAHNVRMGHKDATGNNSLKEGTTLEHAQTNIADVNVQEKVDKHSKMTLIQNVVSEKRSSEDLKQMRHIHDNVENLQSTDLPRVSGQQITEESDMRDKPEDDVWHNAQVLSGGDNSAETNTSSNEVKTELSYRASRKDSFRVNEGLKTLLTQLSTSQVPDSWADFVDSSSAQGQGQQAILLNISRALSLEKNYSGISESTVKEPEGECTTEKLEQQIELDRKSLSLLWKELEEERNASAIAANQTMAMITRLQEEKAAMQMEALQYRRVMEEQSDYDREDLQRMADVVQNLEAEIESYKITLRDQSIVNEIRDQMRLLSPKEREPSITGSTQSFPGFEEEKEYISKQLRRLRKKLHHFSNNSQFVGASKISDKEDAADDTNSEDLYEDADEDVETEKWVVGRRVRNGNNCMKYLSTGIKDFLTPGKDDNEAGETDLLSFEDEISELSGRLNALEADHSFLEHSVNSLKNGKEGEEVIHDIACSLRELRKRGIA